MTPPKAWLDITEAELDALVQRLESCSLQQGDSEIIRAIMESYHYLNRAIADKNITLYRLRKMLFGAGTEKTKDVLGDGDPRSGDPRSATAGSEGDASATNAGPNGTAPGENSQEPKQAPAGHGRNGAAEYTAAGKIAIPHETLKDGDACPDCHKGKVYLQEKPAVMVRIKGQTPVAATVYERERLRCHLCGKVFTAAAPAGMGEEKYDAGAKSMIALMKYGSGMPFYRLEQLQESLGIPLPSATQWEIVKQVAADLDPVYQEMQRLAAQGEILHNDDTNMIILSLGETAKNREREEGTAVAAEDARSEETPPERKGTFTSGIVSQVGGHKVALFFTGNKHAGENLAALLRKRVTGLAPPIQMSDALSRNVPKEFNVLLANCLAHGRRRFVEVADNFPVECRYVLETLREVYRHDALAKEQKLTPEERLRLHQEKSGPLMEKLYQWLEAQFPEKKVEPNSGLGQAISYLLKHWEALTLFLRVPNSPLDNNICERAIKMAILNRKNSYFYKTTRGAKVGDCFMSLIHTCRLCEGNPFDYLTTLQKYVSELPKGSQHWMPWNYQETLRSRGWF